MVRRRASCIGRRVVTKAITYIGLDVHKDTIAVALAEADKRGEVRYGKIANTAPALKSLVSNGLAAVGTNCGSVTRRDHVVMGFSGS